MPTLGADMDAGTLVEWLKHPGDAVSRGDIVAVVDTQKGAIEVEVFEDGVIEQVHVEPGTTVPVGTVLATIRSRGEAGAPERARASDVPHASMTPPPTGPPPAATASLATPPPTSASGPSGEIAQGRARVSPLARKIAQERGVDLAHVIGTGPHGAITREDVERAAASAAPAPASPPAASIPPAMPSSETSAKAITSSPTAGPARHPSDAGGMRAVIAAAMTRSKREIPHYYLSTDIDMGAAIEWLAAYNAARPVTERVLPIAVLLKAVAVALGEVPGLNGHWVDGAFHPGAGIHLGCAIALRGGGLVAPAIHDAAALDLAALMRALADVTRRARAGGLRASELADGTITVTNLGDRGVDAAFGVIHPPQVALVGFGRIRERPWARAGAVTVRPVVTATLSADHRATDGHVGGLFLDAIDKHLQRPETL